jgi:hypothetical protein
MLVFAAVSAAIALAVGFAAFVVLFQVGILLSSHMVELGAVLARIEIEEVEVQAPAGVDSACRSEIAVHSALSQRDIQQSSHMEVLAMEFVQKTRVVVP